MADGGLVFEVEVRADPVPHDERAAALADPVFGTVFTDHMASATWTPADGWHDGRVAAYRPFQVSPAAAVLHYAQEIFEGLKAYRHDDGTIWAFRPDRNARRFANSARRMALPELPEADFVESLKALVRPHQAGGPPAPGQREEPVPAAVHDRARAEPRGASFAPGPVRRDRLPGRPVLRRRDEACLHLAEREAHPRGARRDRRGQVRRQLRQ